MCVAMAVDWCYTIHPPGQSFNPFLFIIPLKLMAQLGRQLILKALREFYTSCHGYGVQMFLVKVILVIGFMQDMT